MRLSEEIIEIMVADSGALSVWHLLTDQGFQEEANYEEKKYFEI